MALKPREKTIALAVGALIGVYGISSWIVAPYQARRAELSAQIAKAENSILTSQGVLETERKLRKDWAELSSAGLQNDQSVADSQLANAFAFWARWAGVNVVSTSSDSPVPAKGFTQVGMHVNIHAKQASLAKLLWAIETSKMPVHLKNLTVTSQKEAVDDLQVSLTIVTISVDVNSGKPSSARKTVALAEGAGRNPS